MKKQFLTVMIAVALAACGEKKKGADEKEVAKADTSAVTYVVDTDASKVTWVGKKVSGKHTGTIRIKSGEIRFGNNTLQAGRFVVDMKTITNIDLTDTAYNKKLTRHLNSSDFFNTDSFPESTFEVTGVKEKKEHNYTHEISGNLSIKGITRNVTFPASVQVADNELKAKGTLIFDRTEFNIRYGSGKFFSNLADNTISDEIELQIDLLAKKQ